MKNIIADFAKQHLTDANEWYSWPVRKLPSGIDIDASNNCFYQNVDLKIRLSEHWKQADAARRLELTSYYIVTWGGVIANHPTTIQQYSSQDSVSLAQSGKTGVASWSKALCIREPETYAIYDARVAVSLNALQMLANTPKPHYYPTLPSRNKRIAGANSVLSKKARQEKWHRFNDGNFYTSYLNCLQGAADCFEADKRPPLYVLEMLLFAKAEELVEAARLTPQ